MQGTAWFASAAGFALAMSATPGPNNALSNMTSAPSPLERRSPRCWEMSDGGTSTSFATAALACSFRTTLKTVMSIPILKRSSRT
jgi:hypothetical protein